MPSTYVPVHYSPVILLFDVTRCELVTARCELVTARCELVTARYELVTASVSY